MKLTLKGYLNIIKSKFMSEVKDILTKLKNVFGTQEVKQEAEQEIVALETEVVDEQVLVDETKVEEVVLAEEEKEMPKEEPVQVQYVTKLELDEFKKTMLELIEKIIPVMETKREVPQELSSDEKVEEISHSPEVQVEKKSNLFVGKENNSIKSRIYSKLFS